MWTQSYWKRELLKIASTLARETKQKKITLRTLASFEKNVFFAFYAIRKLIEAQKLPIAIIQSHVSVISYPSKIKLVTHHRNLLDVRPELELAYDLGKANRESLQLTFICNQIIHSYIFTPDVATRGGIRGVLFRLHAKQKIVLP